MFQNIVVSIPTYSLLSLFLCLYCQKRVYKKDPLRRCNCSDFPIKDALLKNVGQTKLNVHIIGLMMLVSSNLFFEISKL